MMVPQIFLTKDYGDFFAFGLAVYSPFGLKTDYPDSSVVTYWAKRSHLQTANIAITTAYKLTKDVSIASGLDFSLAGLSLSKHITIEGIPSDIIDNKMYGNGWGWHLGLSYKTKLIDYGFRFNSMINYDLSGKVYPENLNSTVSTTIKSPEVFVASLNYHWTKQDDVLLDFQLTNWARVKTIELLYQGSLGDALTEVSENPSTINENYKLANRVALGYKHSFGTGSIIRAGLAYDQTPSNNRDRSPAIPDEDRTWISIGWTQKWLQSSLDLGYAFVNIEKANINSIDSMAGTLVGTWRTHVHVFGLQWNVEWN
jgi:long-chain fatty acid transport protein